MKGPNGEQPEVELSEAVEKTRGFQPWRRVFHAMNGTLVVLALAVFGLPRAVAVTILTLVMIATAALDLLRLVDPKVNVLFFRTFSSLASPREEKGIASSTWYAFSALLAILLFPLDYALAGILVLAWADPAANLVGKRWGRTRFLGGTLRGTGTFVLVAFCALLLFVPWRPALVAAVTTGVAEALPLKLDDNLLIPLFVAGVLAIIAG